MYVRLAFSVCAYTRTERYTAIPQIYSAIENNTPLFNGAYWSPQVVGGSCFIASSFVIFSSASNLN